MSLSFDIGTVSSASAVSPEVQINSVIAKTQAALNELGSSQSGSNWHSAIIRYQVPIGSGVSAGQLVYWKATESSGGTSVAGRYEPAVAELTGANGNGASVESVKSRVEGLIIEATHDGGSHTGTLLTGGYYESTSLMSTCLMGSQTEGTYYLNPDSTHPGTAVPVAQTYGKLQQGILSYYGAGKFSLNLFYQANDHHYHGSSWLTAGNWTSFSSGTHTKPSAWTNAMWYDGSSDAQFITAGPLSPDVTSVFHDGELQRLSSAASAHFCIDGEGVLWYNGGTAPAGNCGIFNHFPFAYGSPVVRDVRASDPLIQAVNNNGIVTVAHNEYSTGSTTANAYAVSAISSGTVSYTPVVSVLKAASGILASYASDGSVTVAASNSIGTPVDAYGMTHNGTVMKSSGLFQYVTFPAGRQASVVITLPVTGISATTQLSAVCWGELAGATGADFSVQSLFIPLPSGSTTFSTSTTSGTMSFSGGYGGTGTAYCEYGESTAALTFSGNGMLVASITIGAAPSADVTFLRLGFKCDIVSAAAGYSTDATAYSSITVTQRATTSTSATQPAIRRCVKMLSSGLALCTSNAADANTCLGVASVINGASTPSDVTYVTAGLLEGFSFGTSSVGTPLFIGADGAPTTTAPVTGYRQNIGTVLSATAMLVAIKPAVLIQ